MAINKINLNGTTYDIGEAAGTNTAESVVEFSSADEENPSSADGSVALIKSGDTHKSLLEKISAGMKNIRYLLKQVSELNTNLTPLDISDQITVGSEVTDFNLYAAYYIAGFVYIRFVGIPTSTNSLIFNISSKYTPSFAIYGWGSFNNATASIRSADADRFLAVWVNSEGDCRVYCTSAFDGTEAFSLLYPLI